MLLKVTELLIIFCTREWHCSPPVFWNKCVISIFEISILLFTVHACISNSRSRQIKINWWCSSFCKKWQLSYGPRALRQTYKLFALEVLNLKQRKLLLAIICLWQDTKLVSFDAIYLVLLVHVLYPLSVNQSTICFLS